VFKYVREHAEIERTRGFGQMLAVEDLRALEPRDVARMDDVDCRLSDLVAHEAIPDSSATQLLKEGSVATTNL
jgi:hypothetical protein